MTIRIAIASDLHIELDAGLTHHRQQQGGDAHPPFGPDLKHAVGADLLILAGDISHHPGDSIRYAEAAGRYCGCPAVVVPGNHDYYGLDMTGALADLRQAAAETGGAVALLDTDRVDFTFGGRRVAVLGATLWTDYCLNGASDAAIADAMRVAGSSLKDHSQIYIRGNQRFTPEHAREQHQAARAWFARELPKARNEADVVVSVSHHAVIGQEACAVEFRGGVLDPAFASDLRAEIAQWQPDLWISGHTHHSFDICIGRSRFVSAQRGYVGVEPGAEDFVPLVVEL